MEGHCSRDTHFQTLKIHMLIQELVREQPLVGSTGSLTVVTFDPRTSPEWLAPHILGDEGVLVTFDRPVLAPQRTTTRNVPQIETVDVSDALFDSQLRPLNMKEFSKRLQQYSGRPLALMAPDILVGAGQPAQEILGLIETLLQTNPVVVLVAVSNALVEDNFDIGTEQNRLVTKLLYRAQRVLNLQPFKTGRADDVTGVFSVSNGPRAEPSQQGSGTTHRELLYTVSNQSVTLSTR